MLPLLVLTTTLVAAPAPAPAPAPVPAPAPAPAPVPSTLAIPDEPQPNRWGASVAVLSEQSSLPLATPVRVPLHPGVALGLVWYARRHTRHLINLGPGISWFHHDPLFDSFTAGLSAGYRYQSSFRLGMEGRLGFGYIHSFATRPQYAVQDGRLREVTDWGRGALWVYAELKLTCVISRRGSARPILAYFSYGPNIETPFSPDNGIWVFPRVIAKVGIEFALPALGGVP